MLVAACSGPGQPAAETGAQLPTNEEAIATPPPSNGTNDDESEISSPKRASVSLRYREFAVGIPFPIFLTPLPGTDILVIATKDGRLLLHDGIDVAGQPFLDIRHLVRNRGEQGLLGVAFSPDYEASGRFYVHYSDSDGDTVLSEFTAEGLVVDPDTEAIVFQVEQPAGNHNGGMIEFGPDGFLYLGLGDGGGANDRFGNGQDADTPLGALLRFDASLAGEVSQPQDNSLGGAKTWSIGLRNPWRFSIDSVSGLILIGDVGQRSFEEISAAPITEAGINYGWPITEGLHCFRPSSDCEIAGLTLPVIEVAHDDGGTCSITGGVVYRGSAIPELYGHYLFSDFCGGYLRSFPVDVEFDEPTDWTGQVGNAGEVVSFGTDADGEVYVLNSDGIVYQLVADRG